MKTHQVSSLGRVAAATLALLLGLVAAPIALANHPVLVEGNNVADGAPGVQSVEPGTAGDYDGDGLVGLAEDNDNATDRIFGTLEAALASPNNGAAQNGRITVISSGRFGEQLIITGANGNVTIEGAPGVEANLDAVVSGSTGNAARQAGSGIVIDAPDHREIVLRNLVIRNFAIGIEIKGASHVHIDNCRLENNRDHGIKVSDEAVVIITNSQINSSGHRVGALGDSTGDSPSDPADPGNGVTYEDSSSGYVAQTIITGSYGAGISASPGRVVRKDLISVDNNRNRRSK
jgi:hypothetical protein